MKTQKKTLRERRVGTRTLLMLLAVLMLIPIVVTMLYSFFSPEEIKAFMETRGNYDASAWMEIKLAPRVFSLSQYYEILIRDTSILRMFVNSVFYTVMILLGQAVVVPMLAYALSRFEFRGRDAVVAGAHARVGADDGDVVVGVARGHERLIVAAAGGEGAEAVADGLEAHGRETGGDAHHVGLGDAAVNHAVGAGLGGLGHADAAHQVCVQIDDVGVVVDHLGNHLCKNVLERLDVGRAVVNHFHASTPSFSSASRSALTASM